MGRPRAVKPLEPGEPLPKALQSALTKPQPGVDSEQLLRDIIDVWGGSRRLATDLCKEFQFAKPGAMVRQRILEMIQRLIVQTTSQGMATAVHPSDLDDEDLESTVRLYFNKMVGQDGSQTTAESRGPGVSGSSGSGGSDTAPGE